ncbi:head-tail connector protein [Pseudomonas putida]|uniref:Phage gp6-like head-tail connector protein n=1 Tax=Pseudomonas putida TaxID=303 RepID=A0A1X0ZLY3_PSEPU|nr:head-tail connector protein [Pseudomonas putida]ORL58109.1 hypothetical protein B7H17_26305 [Pseudomonas putida]
MNILTLNEAKTHLRVDHDFDDSDIEAKLLEATAAVLTYMKGSPLGEPERDSEGAIVKDSNGDVVYQHDSNGLVIRFQIKAAIKLMLGELYKSREGAQEGQVSSNYDYGYGYLPRPVIALLYPLRDPALA